MSNKTIATPVKKVITVGVNRPIKQESHVVEQKPSGIPQWVMPHEKKGDKSISYTICVTNADDMMHRTLKAASKGQFSPRLVEGNTIPKGWVGIHKITASNIGAALEEALDSFYSIYIKESDDSED